MSLVEKHSIEDLEMGLIFKSEQINFIENYQELNEIYERICGINDNIISEIASLLEFNGDEHCKKYKEDSSVYYCYDECESFNECYGYTDISDRLKYYIDRFLDSDMIAEITLQALLRDNLVGTIKKKETPFADAILDFYHKNNSKVSCELSKETIIFINYKQSASFMQFIDNESSLIYLGDMNRVMVAEIENEEGVNRNDELLRLKE